MDSNTDTVYVLAHEGAWHYLLTPLARFGRGAAVLADGEPLAPHTRGGWWVGDHEAKRLEARIEQYPSTVGYRLRDVSAASARFPTELTPEAWAERGFDGDDAAAALYERIREDVAPEVVAYAGPRVRLDGEPVPDDGLPRWTAKLPHELQNHSELLHLFPGVMHGVRDAIVAAVRELPGVSFVDAKTSPVEVHLSMPYDPPRMYWADRYGSTGRKLRGREQRTETYRAIVPVVAPYSVEGSNRAEAAAHVRRLIAEAKDRVSAAGQLKACGRCAGRGVVGSEA